MLTCRKFGIAELTAGTRQAMFRLFSQYYENVSFERFDADLGAKNFVLLLEEDGELGGFTSASILERNYFGESCRFVFSGDTIMARRHWGKQILARQWLREMGWLARRSGSMRLFWFLIVKGHRTYRYLPAFALNYVPHRSNPPDQALRSMRDALACEMFGKAFDPDSGIVHFAEPRGNLQPDWAAPNERERRLPDVAHFLKANPGFATGDELACLCEIARANMRPLAQRWFDRGFREE